MHQRTTLHCNSGVYTAVRTASPTCPIMMILLSHQCLFLSCHLLLLICWTPWTSICCQLIYRQLVHCANISVVSLTPDTSWRSTASVTASYTSTHWRHSGVYFTTVLAGLSPCSMARSASASVSSAFHGKSHRLLAGWLQQQLPVPVT